MHPTQDAEASPAAALPDPSGEKINAKKICGGEVAIFLGSAALARDGSRGGAKNCVFLLSELPESDCCSPVFASPAIPENNIQEHVYC